MVVYKGLQAEQRLEDDNPVSGHAIHHEAELDDWRAGSKEVQGELEALLRVELHGQVLSLPGGPCCQSCN